MVQLKLKKDFLTIKIHFVLNVSKMNKNLKIHSFFVQIVKSQYIEIVFRSLLKSINGFVMYVFNLEIKEKCYVVFYVQIEEV